MRILLALCGKELRVLARDWHGLAVLFAVPILFILLLSLALKDAFDPSAPGRLQLRIVDQDHGALAQQFITRLTQLPGVEQRSDADTQVIVLQGFSELLATRQDFAANYLAGSDEPSLLRVDYAPSTLPTARGLVALSVRQALLQVQSDYLFKDVLGYSQDQRAAFDYLADPRRLPIKERFRNRGGAVVAAPNAVQQNVPGWLIFAMFFAVIPLATSFVVERTQGSLLRLRVLGVSATTLMLSKALPYYLVNLLQMLVMFAVGIWLVPALGGDRLDPGHSIVGLWLIGSATSFAAIALALCVAICVRTSLQATVAGGAISLLLAALGGVMVPKLVMPPTMQALTQFSPMAWSLDGFSHLLVSGEGVPSVLPAAGALLLLALAALTVAGLLYRHNLRHPSA